MEIAQKYKAAIEEAISIATM